MEFSLQAYFLSSSKYGIDYLGDLCNS